MKPKEQAVYDYIKANPGQHIYQIATGMRWMAARIKNYTTRLKLAGLITDNGKSSLPVYTAAPKDTLNKLMAQVWDGSLNIQ